MAPAAGGATGAAAAAAAAAAATREDGIVGAAGKPARHCPPATAFHTAGACSCYAMFGGVTQAHRQLISIFNVFSSTIMTVTVLYLFISVKGANQCAPGQPYPISYLT